MSKLYIAIYKPKYRNYKHWAFFGINRVDNLWSYKQRQDFSKNTITKNSISNTQYKKNILVANINKQDDLKFEKIVSKVNMDNRIIE